jgi:ribosomal-protein-alanine N-acetyltransferase
MKIEIRPMGSDDLPQVLAIEQSWPYLSKWGEEGYRIVLGDSKTYVCLVAEDIQPDTSATTPITAGFAVLALLIDHCELCNLVVLPSYISKKVGCLLLMQCIEIAQHFGITRMFLEVRQSNDRAIRFYEKSGFRIISQRKDYYRNPNENAWIMERRIARSALPFEHTL